MIDLTNASSMRAGSRVIFDFLFDWSPGQVKYNFDQILKITKLKNSTIKLRLIEFPKILVMVYCF